MAKALGSYLGKVHLLESNPRTIRAAAFNTLVESVERDPDFLLARGIVVWRVPDALSPEEGGKSPFRGQEGRFVVLGGNQRMKALVALGHSELKKEWVIEARNADGSWFTEGQAERFILLDNGGDGISGENDYEKMLASFSTAAMKLTGIDFSAFEGMMEEASAEVGKKPPEEEAEEGEHGERNEGLEEFIRRREASRDMLKEIDEAGFHLLVVFPSFEEKVRFVSEAGLTGRRGRVAVDGGVYLDLVFESYAQKMEFVRGAGLATDEETMGEGELEVVYDMFCDGRALARKMGIPLKETGLHFRDRKVDSQLAEMAQEEQPQKSEEEMEEELFRRAKGG